MIARRVGAAASGAVAARNPPSMLLLYRVMIDGCGDGCEHGNGKFEDEGSQSVANGFLRGVEPEAVSGPASHSFPQVHRRSSPEQSARPPNRGEHALVHELGGAEWMGWLQVGLQVWLARALGSPVQPVGRCAECAVTVTLRCLSPLAPSTTTLSRPRQLSSLIHPPLSLPPQQQHTHAHHSIPVVLHPTRHSLTTRAYPADLISTLQTPPP